MGLEGERRDETSEPDDSNNGCLEMIDFGVNEIDFNVDDVGDADIYILECTMTLIMFERVSILAKAHKLVALV